MIKVFKENDVDFYINRSLSEGMSFALMEAMSLSIPVICSSIPGNLEIVNSENGYILNTYDENEIKKYADKLKWDISKYKIISQCYKKAEYFINLAFNSLSSFLL